MQPYVKFLPVCPEVEIGLGTPRDPIKVVATKTEKKLIQPSSERDLSEPMRHFAVRFLDKTEVVDGFLLKSRSPSCGLKDVKFYPRPALSAANARGAGFFGEQVLKRFGHLAVEDEARLNNTAIRHHYLTKLFCLADFRHAKRSGSMRRLVDFHARHKFLLMTYRETSLREMGRIVANASGLSAPLVFGEYEKELFRALERPPRVSNTVNALQHAFGFFSKDLTAKEKAHFLGLLEKYRKGRGVLAVLLGLLGSWTIRFDKTYLKSQAFFEPYPEKLMEEIL
jgi:uncharacterized protein YbgA (DUF1722 family)/uncharacterized protein YbbK (DUF523 family)